MMILCFWSENIAAPELLSSSTVLIAFGATRIFSPLGVMVYASNTSSFERVELYGKSAWDSASTINWDLTNVVSSSISMTVPSVWIVSVTTAFSTAESDSSSPLPALVIPALANSKNPNKTAPRLPIDWSANFILSLAPYIRSYVSLSFIHFTRKNNARMVINCC